MQNSIVDIQVQLGARIKSRRRTQGLTQADASARAGVPYRTWRRMEKDGSASIEDLIRAALALRCEQDLGALFPEPAASSMDELLKRQQASAKKAGR